jgi:hypothetical protein
MKHSQPAEKISEAVFRGRKTAYNFEVYSIKDSVEDAAGVYVISRRVEDRRGRWHHAIVCFGRTDSFVSELKRHKKARCVKDHKANVICTLREEKEKVRLKIEDDLRSAHAFACNFDGEDAAPAPNK